MSERDSTTFISPTDIASTETASTEPVSTESASHESPEAPVELLDDSDVVGPISDNIYEEVLGALAILSNHGEEFGHLKYHELLDRLEMSQDARKRFREVLDAQTIVGDISANEQKSLNDIAARMGMSRESARNTEGAALRKIKAHILRQHPIGELAIMVDGRLNLNMTGDDDGFVD